LATKDEFSISVEEGELFGLKVGCLCLLLYSKQGIPLFIKNISKIRLLWIDKVKKEKHDRLQKQQMIQQSGLAQMGEMISMIAHQWRQPLSAISSTVATLQMQLILDNFDLESKEERDVAKEYFLDKFENIASYVQNLTTTIDDFRDFYRPNKTSVRIKLDKVISKALKIIETFLVIDNIEIIKKYHSLERIELYESEVMQVILNILKNAQDNFKEKSIKHPYIKIKTKGNTISISDNGGGVQEDFLDKIFEPYFSTKEVKKGTGLGLYISKTIIEEHHNGRLSVKNTQKGLCFTIVFQNDIPLHTRK
jgi:signal transduction histidine kinase